MWHVGVASKVGVAGNTVTLPHCHSTTVSSNAAQLMGKVESDHVCLLVRMCRGFCFIAHGARRMAVSPTRRKVHTLHNIYYQQ